MSTGNAVVDGLVELATNKATEANALAEKVANSKGNFAKSVKDVRENNTEDAEVVSYREWEEKVYAELNRRREAIDKHIVTNHLKDVGDVLSGSALDKAETDHKGLSKEAREAWKAAESTAKMFGVELTDKAPELKTLAGRTGSLVRQGAGGRRFRFDDVTVNGESVKSLSKAALAITSKSGVKVTAKDLQDALIDDAKTDDPNKMNGHTFKHSVTKDGVTTEFDVTVFKAQDTESEAETTEDDNADE